MVELIEISIHIGIDGIVVYYIGHSYEGDWFACAVDDHENAEDNDSDNKWRYASLPFENSCFMTVAKSMFDFTGKWHYTLGKKDFPGCMLKVKFHSK